MASPPSSEGRPFAGVLAGLAGLVKHVTGNLNRIAEDVARDAGEVARDAEALGRAAQAQWGGLVEGARATPRLWKVVAAGTKVLALWRWHRLRALARGEDPVDNPVIHRALARAAREACVELRGGILKVGQLASCRPDLLPAPWIEELSELQDRVPAVAVDAIVASIEEELGAPVVDRFGFFDPEALAAASLAQVHAARAADQDVVVKVQVPGIADVIDADIAALKVLAKLARDVLPGVDLAPIVSELAIALTAELDYRQEAQNLADFAAASAGAGDRVLVPAVVDELSTGRILVMERIAGERLTDALDRLSEENPEARDRVCATIVSSVARQIFVHGVIHADPHPGNFLVTPDGEVAVLDFGCVLRLGDDERRAWARLFAALVTRDERRAAAELAALGFVAADEAELLAVAATIVDGMRPGTDAAEMDWNAQLVEFTERLRAAGASGQAIQIPRSFVLLARVLGTVAGLLVRHRPRLQPFALIAPFVMAQRAA
jgi:ubiquinone biosynthesis protein